MNIQTLVPPAFEPVTLEEAYTHLRWDTEDVGSPSETGYPLSDLISRNITSAREYVEQVTRRALIEQTLRYVLPGFTEGEWPCDWRIKYVELLRPPLIAFLSVKYLDKNEVLQTLDPSHYYVDTDSSIVPRLCFRSTLDPSIATDQRTDAVRIEWVAGYPGAESPVASQAQAAANVPKALKDAILLQVQLLCDRFQKDERMDIERTRDALLNSYIVRRY